MRANSTADPDNNTGSNDESDDASIGLNNRDGSDNGSGTQVSFMDTLYVGHVIFHSKSSYCFESTQLFISKD